MGIAGWMIALTADAVVAWALYLLLKPVNTNLSMLAAWFRLVYVAIFASLFVNHFSVLLLVSDPDVLSAFEPLSCTRKRWYFLAYDSGVHIRFLFFGLHIFVLGALIFESGYMPRLLGAVLIVTSVGYLIDSFGNFLSADYANNETMFVVFVAVPAILRNFL